MDMHQHRSTEKPEPRGPRGDFKRLQQSGGATVDELRQFLSEMRGKGPQEMLGVIAQSNLVRSTITATVMTVVLLVVLTIVPYGWGKVFPADDAPKTVTVGTPAVKRPDKPMTPAAGDAAKPGAAPATNAEDQPAKGDELLDKLGIGEEKTAAPNVNPLESKGDDLLKGLE